MGIYKVYVGVYKVYMGVYKVHIYTLFDGLAYNTCGYFATPGAHQMEPPSPIHALGVNPFPSRFIIRTLPRGDFARRRWEEPITTTK